MAILKARPSELEKEPLLVFMTAARLLDLKLGNGGLCYLSSNGSTSARCAGVAWTSSRADLKDGLVGISKWLQQQSHIKLGSDVLVTRSEQVMMEAPEVKLESLDKEDTEQQSLYWAWVAKMTIPEQHKYLAPKQRVFLAVGRHRCEFEISPQSTEIYKIGNSTTFVIDDNSHYDSAMIPNFDWTRIGGLSSQIETVELAVRLLLLQQKTHLPGYSPCQGILVYGAKGTGKTLFREEIAKAKCWVLVDQWKPGYKVLRSSKPRLIQVDFQDKLARTAVAELRELFSTVTGTPTLIIGELDHPNHIDIHLRGTDKFEMEIELPVPDALQRKEILSTISQNHLNGPLLDIAASKTHGYVGEDLKKLINSLWKSAIVRTKVVDQSKVDSALSKSVAVDENREDIPQFTMADLETVLTEIRPSALQEVFLEKPNVRWNDIGGQHGIKKELQDAIEWPLRYPEQMARLGLDSTKGVLLYGPPGCSKTLLVKALATEADVNFLAVKGAELNSMYVGESERSTREVFRKARAASPCIIFFDEIDAIASRGKGGSDLNVLTTLLNEMDGFEELRNVLVVAATNKPQSIDPALMRPGRFDNVVYIGPPDLETRREILKKRFDSFSYDSDVKAKLNDYATQTEGFSGAEVVAVCKTAAKYALASGRDVVQPEDMDHAVRSTSKSLTAEMLDEYEIWNAARR